MIRLGAPAMVAIGATAMFAATAPASRARGEPVAHPSATVAGAFAAALGVSPADVASVACMATTSGTSVLVGLAKQGARRRAAIVVGRGCSAVGKLTVPRARVVLRLEDADAVEALAVVDLASIPKSVVMGSSAVGPADQVRVKTAMRIPALLLRTRRLGKGPGGQYAFEALDVVELRGRPRLLAHEPSGRTAPSGEGFETLQVQFKKGTGARNWPDIILLQHTLPRRDDPDPMPGPPLTVRLHAMRDRYQRQ